MTNQLTTNQPFWLSVAYKYTKDKRASEELVQEAIVRYLHKSEEDIENPRAYIAATIRHLHANTRRRKKSQQAYEQAIIRNMESVEIKMNEHESETRTLIRTMDNLLSPAEKAVLLLRTAFDVDYDFLQQMFGLSYENARQLLFRAKAKLSKRGNLMYSVQDSPLENLFLKASRNGDIQPLVAFLKMEMQKNVLVRA